MGFGSVCRNVLLVSGVLFWIFVLLTFVPWPSDMVFGLLWWSGLYFWMFVMGFEATVLVFFALILLVALLLDEIQDKRNKARKDGWLEVQD